MLSTVRMLRRLLRNAFLVTNRVRVIGVKPQGRREREDQGKSIPVAVKDRRSTALLDNRRFDLYDAQNLISKVLTCKEPFPYFLCLRGMRFPPPVESSSGADDKCHTESSEGLNAVVGP